MTPQERLEAAVALAINNRRNALENVDAATKSCRAHFADGYESAICDLHGIDRDTFRQQITNAAFVLPA